MKDGPGHPQVDSVYAVAASQPITTSPALPALDATSVFDVHGDLLFRHLQRLGVREADLSDALQDTLIVVHRRLGAFDRTRPVEPWLYGICAKIAAAYRRRAHVRRELPSESMSERADEAADDPEARLDARQSRARLDALLAHLEPERRAVLVMFELEEMPCDRIAAALGVPIGTVYSRLHTARRELVSLARRSVR